MDVACGDEFDEAFLLELDAVEAAAVQRSHASHDVTPSTLNDAGVEPQRNQRVSAHAHPHSSAMLEQSCSTGRSLKPVACPHEAASIVGLYRWTVGSISVQDDAAAEGSGEEGIGQVK